MKKEFYLSKKDKKLALLIDPDWALKKDWLFDVLASVNNGMIDLILVGGSLVINIGKIEETILTIKKLTDIPVYLFPGHPIQLNKHADGILLLSLISGRNPEFLIGQHVISAPLIKSYNLNVLPTGYMIIGEKATSVHYMSQTHSLPSNKPDIALATAMAGEMLGLKCIYLEGGSGADKNPPIEIIRLLSEQISIPLIVGGGINNPKKIQVAFDNGANMVVIGTAIEKMPALLEQDLKTLT